MEIDRNLNPNDNVNIELDDGDNRDIHVNSIRFLPPNYPLVGKIPIFLFYDLFVGWNETKNKKTIFF